MRQGGRLDGKVALITGAAFEIHGELMGLGGATARLFTRERARVLLTDINDERDRKTAEEIRAGGGEQRMFTLMSPMSRIEPSPSESRSQPTAIWTSW